MPVEPKRALRTSTIRLVSHTQLSVLINGVQVVQLTTSLNKVKAEQEMASTKKSSIDLDNDDFLSGSSSVKTEIASLSSQVISLVLLSTILSIFSVI